MLHFETIEPRTLSILKELINIEELKSFSLVGGTALALQYGHRTSIDIDLFSTEQFDYFTIISVLKKNFGDKFVFENKESKWAIFGFIDSIKIDVIKYNHLQIFDNIFDDNIRMYDSKEIAAMKIQAILGRGRKKDFWDLAELLQHYSLQEIIDFHSKKYPNQQLLISIPQAVTYFEEAEESEDPISLKGQTWESVKKTISQKVNDYLK